MSVRDFNTTGYSPSTLLPNDTNNEEADSRALAEWVQSYGNMKSGDAFSEAQMSSVTICVVGKKPKYCVVSMLSSLAFLLDQTQPILLDRQTQ